MEPEEEITTHLDLLIDDALYELYTYLSFRDVIAVECSRKIYSPVAGPRYFKIHCKNYNLPDSTAGFNLADTLSLFGEFIEILKIDFDYCRTPEEFVERHNAIEKYCIVLRELILNDFRHAGVLPTDNIRFTTGLRKLGMGRHIATEYYVREYILANKDTLQSFAVDIGQGSRIATVLLNESFADNVITHIKLTVAHSYSTQQGRTQADCSVEDFRKFIHLFNRIESIELFRCNFLSDALMGELALLPNLRRANFEKCQLQTRHILILVRTAKKLLKLALNSCGHLTRKIILDVHAINPVIEVNFEKRK